MIDYMKEVNDYGRSLPPVDKQVAREVFTQLLLAGFDYEWLYFGIENLGQRNIARHRGLFFYKPFQDEVSAMVVANRDAEEQRKQRNKQICEAIEQQIRQARQQNIITVNLQKNQRPRPTPEERLATIIDMEE